MGLAGFTLAGLPRSARASGPRVLVVGGGPAGVAAALDLVEGGASVTLVEAADRLGGRLRGWTEPLVGAVEHEDPAVEVGAGLHAVGPEDTAVLDLLARFGLGGLLGPALRLELPARAAGLDAACLARFGLPARALDPALPARAWAWARQPRRYLRGDPQGWLWGPLADLLQALGGELRLGTAARALTLGGGRVTGVEVGLPGGRLRVVPRGAWSQDADPAGMPVHVHDGPQGLWALHGRCTHDGDPVLRLHDRLCCPACGSTWQAQGQPVEGPATAALRRLEVLRLPPTEGGGFRVELPDTTWTLPADQTLLALDPPALARLAGPVLPDAGALAGVPFAVARFWLDRPADPRRAAAVLLPDGRHAALGLLVHRLQDGAAAWAARAGGSVVELQAGRDLPPEQTLGWSQALLDALHQDLVQAWPELAGAAVLKARLVRGRQRVHLGPGHAARALPTRPGPPGLWLAGEAVAFDGGDGPAPLLWERAVRTGRSAAADILAGHVGP